MYKINFLDMINSVEFDRSGIPNCWKNGSVLLSGGVYYSQITSYTNLSRSYIGQVCYYGTYYLYKRFNFT